MMKKMIGLLILAMSMLGASAISAENCKNPQSQLAMNTCAGQDYQREDVGLNKTYKKLVSKLKKDRREKLKEIQITWIKYRDLQCDFDSSNYQGGSIYPWVRSRCLSQMTKQRNKDIKAMLEDATM